MLFQGKEKKTTAWLTVYVSIQKVQETLGKDFAVCCCEKDEWKNRYTWRLDVSGTKLRNFQRWKWF